jgi:hypothetical protein
MIREQILRRRIQRWTWFFIIGLIISGATAIPLATELEWLVRWFGVEAQTSSTAATELARWLLRIREALQDTATKHPMLFYGTDWLAFGHFVIAVAFIGVLRDPVRNRWLFEFGLIACVLVIPFALIFGAVRDIPYWWRLIDCSFGVFGALPLWLCRRWSLELEQYSKSAASSI